MVRNESYKQHDKMTAPETPGTLTESDSVVAGVMEGERIEMPLARILARICPTHESANASMRPKLSNFSMYRTTSRTKSESFLFASVVSEATLSRSDRASLRIWLAEAACSVELPGKFTSPGGCFHVNRCLKLKRIYVLGPGPPGCVVAQ